MEILMGVLPDGEPLGFFTRDGFNLYITDTNDDYEIVYLYPTTATPNQKESNNVKHEQP